MTSGPRTLRVAAAVLILSSAPLRARDEGAARYMARDNESLRSWLVLAPIPISADPQGSPDEERK